VILVLLVLVLVVLVVLVLVPLLLTRHPADWSPTLSMQRDPRWGRTRRCLARIRC